jgi:predicted pyridoxine 5'-phosphate oxidase superfamily flavin-nucleotide-binding protein
MAATSAAHSARLSDFAARDGLIALTPDRRFRYARSMSELPTYPSDVAFTAAVKAQQTRMGSRRAYAHMEEDVGWQTHITPELAAFIAARDSLYLATANAAGQPYIQHRGGPPGFLRVLDEQTIGFADFAGNKQYITLGNIQENPKTHVFLMDYAQRRRIKIWGELSAVEGDAELNARMKPADYKARVERVMLIKVAAWDVNCPQHIPLKIDVDDVKAAIETRDARIAELEAQVRELRSAGSVK